MFILNLGLRIEHQIKLRKSGGYWKDRTSSIMGFNCASLITVKPLIVYTTTPYETQHPIDHLMVPYAF